MRIEPSDAWAIERSLTEPAFFDVIFDRYYSSVYSFVTRAVGSAAGADLAQDVFVVAFDQRRRFRLDSGSARPWLFGIARNVLRRWYRTEARRRRAEERMSNRRPSTSEFASDAVDRLSADALRPHLRTALASISQPERDVLFLFALGELSYAEIAETLDVPVGTVRSRLHRARLRLQEGIGERYGGFLLAEGSRRHG